MAEKVLFGDDDVNILNAFKRAFRKRYNFEVAEDPEKAIYVIRDKGPFTVIVSDMKMPKMDGASFLSRLKDVCPHTMRIMLTGNSDLQTAVEAVNKGEVFRFLNKPCSAEDLGVTIDEAIVQFYAKKSDRDLLEHTLTGCLKLLSDIVDASKSRLFDDQVSRSWIKYMCKYLQIRYDWVMDIACSLLQIGAVTLPHYMLGEREGVPRFQEHELELYYSVPKMSASLIEHIPRLEQVSQALENKLNGDDTIKTQVLYAVYAALLPLPKENEEKRWELAKTYFGSIDEKVIAALAACRQAFGEEEVDQYEELELPLKDLLIGDILHSNIELSDGKVLVAKGTTLSATLLKRVSNFSRVQSVNQPIVVARKIKND